MFQGLPPLFARLLATMLARSVVLLPPPSRLSRVSSV
jgi:hypothetical protein